LRHAIIRACGYISYISIFLGLPRNQLDSLAAMACLQASLDFLLCVALFSHGDGVRAPCGDGHNARGADSDFNKRKLRRGGNWDQEFAGHSIEEHRRLDLGAFERHPERRWIRHEQPVHSTVDGAGRDHESDRVVCSDRHWQQYGNYHHQK